MKLIVYFVDKEKESCYVPYSYDMSHLEYVLCVRLSLDRIINGNMSPNIIDILRAVDGKLDEYESQNNTDLSSTPINILGIVIDPRCHHYLNLSRWADKLLSSSEDKFKDDMENPYIKSISISPENGRIYDINCINPNLTDNLIIGLTEPVEYYFIANKTMYGICNLNVYTKYREPQQLFDDPSSISWIETELMKNDYKKPLKVSSSEMIYAIKCNSNPLSPYDLTLLVDYKGSKIGDILYHNSKMFLVKYSALPHNYVTVSSLGKLCNIAIDMAHNVKTVIVYDETDKQKNCLYYNNKSAQEKALLWYCTHILVDSSPVTDKDSEIVVPTSDANKLADVSKEDKNNKSKKLLLAAAIEEIKSNLKVLEDYYNEQFNQVKEHKE